MLGWYEEGDLVSISNHSMVKKLDDSTFEEQTGVTEKGYNILKWSSEEVHLWDRCWCWLFVFMLQKQITPLFWNSRNWTLDYFHFHYY